jgi:predicted Na+-dependent transporter
MPVDGTIPEAVLSIVAAATVFTIMFTLGLGIVLSEFSWVWGRPGLVVKGLFSLLIAVPALALIVTRAFDLGRAAQIGIVLMAISPGAPVALRRSLAAGAHRAFAHALQILVAMLAVVSMPMSVAVLNELYVGHATIAPGHLAWQVFTAQLLPLALGITIHRAFPTIASRLEPSWHVSPRYCSSCSRSWRWSTSGKWSSAQGFASRWRSRSLPSWR